MSKPRLAIFDLACCEGCQLQIVNMEDELLSLLSVVDPVEWREALSNQSDTYDVAIIEGSITRQSDEDKVKEIRERATYVIAMGACATFGGVNKLKNKFAIHDVKETVYGDAADMPHLDTFKVKALHETVKVDFEVQGCPIDASELAYVVKSLLAGKTPRLPDYPVCVECKMKENGCRYDNDEICLGPLTRAGCDARCPSNGYWCFGCRGFLPDANTAAAAKVMSQYGKSVEDLESKMALFGSH
jgi:coenzyme F420-reducing hydrogenase gamma subunit